MNKILLKRNIQILEDCSKVSDYREFKCLISDCGRIWLAKVSNVFNGKRGCPSCKNKNEKIIYNTLLKFNIEFKHNFYMYKIHKCINNKFSVDFYLPYYNIIIEYNGRQHYEPVQFGGISKIKAKKIFKRTQLKDKYLKYWCHYNKIILIEIDGREIFSYNLEKYIIKQIINKLGDIIV